MRTLLDEHLAPAVAEVLRARGLDVEAVAERPDLAAASDAMLMDTAAGEGRAIVTNDVGDFRRIAAQRVAEGVGHGGLIFVPWTRDRSIAATGALADAIEAVMRADPAGIADGERWLAPSR